MRGEAWRNWMSGFVEVIIWRDFGPGKQALQVVVDERGFSTCRWEDVAEGKSATRPTFILNEDVAAALLDALAKIEAPSNATAEHLRDAIGTRDRLLTLLEKVVK